jgi:hypothetical protein
MPIDTAVTATTSDIASATVASSSTPQRRLENVLSEMGDVKPAVPVSSVMDVSSFTNQRVVAVVISDRIWAMPLTNKGDSMFFG